MGRGRGRDELLALALFRDGRVLLANPRWRALASGRAPGGGWIVVDDGVAPRTYRTLGALAAAELERLPVMRGAVTLQCRRRDGARLLRVRLERVTPPGKQPLGVVAADDVTGERARRAEVIALRHSLPKREQLAAIGRVATGAAHDLGNALNALALRVSSLPRADVDEAKEHVRGMTEAIAMMRQTLDRLDRFAGRRMRPLVPVDVGPVVRAAVDVAGLRLAPLRKDAADIAVALALPRRLPRVVGDPAELTNVLMNLLLNARDAMPEGGTVTVRAAAEKKRVMLRIADEGPGFAAEHLERVFEPFFTTKGAHGSGLGLSLAYGVMQAIGGSITVGNRAKGGAEILLELPIYR